MDSNKKNEGYLYHIVVRIFAIAFFVIYAVGGIQSRFYPESEKYPFFSWFLFSKVPPRINSAFDLRIVSSGEETFDPPVMISDNKDVLSGSRSYREYVSAILFLANAILSDREEDIIKYRDFLEESFVIEPVVYEIVQVKFDTLGKWRGEEFLEVMVIASFTSNK